MGARCALDHDVAVHDVPVEVEVDHKKSAEWISPKRPLKPWMVRA